MTSEIKKIIFFTNIVAPYRVSFFNDLENYKHSFKGQFDFEVFFMRLSEVDRHWNVDLSIINFKYTIGNGFYLYQKPIHIHFNPLLIWKLIKSRDEIILGSSWNDLNILLVIILKRIGFINVRLSIWSEANYLTLYSSKRSVLRDMIRKWVFNTIDGSFIVPGEMSLLSFEKWAIKYKNVIKLPNLPSNEVFSTRSEPRIIEKKPVFLIVARLEEELKGILNFFLAIGVKNLKHIEVRIAGTGNSYNSYKKYVFDNDLADTICFLGQLSQLDLSLEYKNADVFVLPSYSDPSPLSLVEALYSGLTMFVSNRCGNYFEAVVEGENGYTFDPFLPEEIRRKFEFLMEQRGSWSVFSKKSIELADKNFNPEKVMNTFISSIIG